MEESSFKIADNSRVESLGSSVTSIGDRANEATVFPNEKKEKDDVSTADTASKEAAKGDDPSGKTERTDTVEAGSGADVPDIKDPAEAFDAADPENVKLWDAEFRTEKGYNFERFQKEVTANMAKEGGKPELNANTVAYLESKGFTKADIDTYIATQLNANEAAATKAKDKDTQFFDAAHKVGQEVGATADGPALLKEAVGWASSGALSKEARERYNKVQDGDDHAAKVEAMENLIFKYSRTEAFKTAEAERKAATRNRRPERDATDNQGSGKGKAQGDAITDEAEYRRLRKEAAGNTPKLKELARRASLGGIG